MSSHTFFSRAVVERAAKRMREHKPGSGTEILSMELKVAIGWKEKTDAEIRAAFREALAKCRYA